MQNGNVLTRRAAIGVCAAAVSQACSPVRSSQGGRPLPAALANLAAEFLLFDKDGLNTRGLDGKKFHCLPVPKGTWAVSVSADGSAAAWTPARIPSLTEPDGGLYLVRNRKSGNDHDIVIPAIFPILSALSSSGSHVAAVSARPQELNWKLFFFMLDEKGVTNQHDLSALCDPALLKNAETLGICERGETLVIGSREAFQVIDLVKQQVLSRVEGRFPSLRPSGDKIAFATPSRALAIQEVRTRKHRATQGFTGCGESAPGVRTAGSSS